MDREVLSVIILGLAFMFIFTAFNTASIIQNNVVIGVNNEYRESWNGQEWKSYNSLALTYLVFSTSNWIAPFLLNLIGIKMSIIFGGLTYTIFMVNFIFPTYHGLTSVSVLEGIGTAVIWIAGSSFVAIISTPNTVTRNDGIFWSFFQSSLLFGNLFVYFEFDKIESIDAPVRFKTYLFLAIASIIGTALVFLLPTVDGKDKINQSSLSQVLSTVYRLCKSKTILILCAPYLYSGILLSFYSGVYSFAITSTKAFGTDRHKLAGISGMILGFGEMSGGIFYTVFRKNFKTNGSRAIMTFAIFIHIIAYVIIYINLPAGASINETDDTALITSNLHLALLVSYLIGLGDAFCNIMIYAVVAIFYKIESSCAYGLLYFVQFTASATVFFYSNYFGIDVHVYILISSAIIANICFYIVTKSNEANK